MDLINSYNYLENIPLFLINNKIKIFDFYNLSGARLSGKTTSITICLAKLIAASLFTKKKVGVYAARFKMRDVPSLASEVKIALDDFKIDYEFTNKGRLTPYPTFTFKNGSFIQIVGITNTDSTTNLKGLAKCWGFDLVIDWVEEANELQKKDFQDLRMSIRGAKREVHFTSCNPDLEYQYHISELIRRAPFEKYYLSNFGEQKTPWSAGSLKGINHYTTFKVNPHLALDKIAQLEDLKISDPVKAVSWYYGMPGSLAGTIFGNYLPIAIKDITFNPVHFMAGVDLGYSDAPTAHPTTCLLVSSNQDFTMFHCQSEYYHDNLDGKHKPPDLIYRELIDYLVNCVEKYNISSLPVRVDYGGGGLVAIDYIKKIKSALEEEWAKTNPLKYTASKRIIISPVNKEVWLNKDRVDATCMLLSTGRLSLNKYNTPNLVRQMNMMTYKENRVKDNWEVQIAKINDDTWDALCYAIMPYLKSAISSLNPLLRREKNYDSLL